MATTKQTTKQVELTPEQEQAAALVAEGKPVYEIAEQVDTDEATLAEWQASPYFVAAVNRHRKATWAAAQDRLRALVPSALLALEDAVGRCDVRAATEVLKAAGVYGNLPKPSGEVAPEAVMAQQAKEWAEAEADKQKIVEGRYVLSAEKEEMAQKRFRELRAGAV